MCLNMDPSTRFELQNVNSFFETVVNETQAPCLHIRPNLFPGKIKHIKVQRIIEASGIGSGLVLEIRRTLQRKNWKNAILTLNPLKNNWYEITNIYWKVSP